MKFRLKTDEHRRLPLDMSKVNQYCSRWKPQTTIEIEIARRRQKHSDPQRAFYWAVIIPQFCEELGYDQDEYELFHRQLKITYYNVKPDKKGIYRNKDIPAVFANDSDKNVKERKDFMEWVLRKASENGIYIDTGDLFESATKR
jgi:hypothetical protein